MTTFTSLDDEVCTNVRTSNAYARGRVAHQEPCKHAHHTSLDGYAILYAFPRTVPLTALAQDTRLYERLASDGLPKYRVCFTFQRTNGKISCVSVHHSANLVRVKPPNRSCHGVLKQRGRGTLQEHLRFHGR